MGHDDIYGMWLVWTQPLNGESEDVLLGVYTGFIDNIAFHLAPQSNYYLRFQKCEPKIAPMQSEVSTVTVHVEDWMSREKHDAALASVRQLFGDRDVDIVDSMQYNGFQIIKKDNYHDQNGGI